MLFLSFWNRITCMMAGCMLLALPSYTQNLSFTRPAMFLPDAKTDKAIDITNFNGVYFVTWKDAGDQGDVRFSCLGKQYDTETISTAVTIPGQQTNAAPVLRVLDKHIYLFWISKQGNLKYVINNTETTFNTEAVYEVKFTMPVKLSLGVTAAPMNGKVMITSHADGKDQLICALLKPDNDGKFADAEAMAVNNEKSADYPFVVNLAKTSARFCWRGKDKVVYYADYNTDSKAWTKTFPLSSARTKTAPAIYQVWNSNRLFYIWSGNKNDNRIYYASALDDETPSAGPPLPAVLLPLILFPFARLMTIIFFWLTRASTTGCT